MPFSMKQTEQDRQFAGRFAEALQPHVTREQEEGKSLAEIGSKLGVTGPGLQKQLAGGTPSIRTIALAYRHYKIAVSYEGIDFAKAVAGKKKALRVPEKQLLLPFEITAPAASKSIVLKLVPGGIR